MAQENVEMVRNAQQALNGQDVIGIRDGKFVSWQKFTDRDEALAAAGLSDEEAERIPRHAEKP
jgi:hypothetical protein